MLLIRIKDARFVLVSAGTSICFSNIGIPPPLSKNQMVCAIAVMEAHILKNVMKK